MTQVQPPIVSSANVEAFVASALLWLGALFGVILRFGWQGRSARLARLLRRAERAVECILFLKAVALCPPPSKKPSRTPRVAPQGFRRVASNGRLFFKGAAIRAKKASGAERVIALLCALMSPANAIRYFQKKLRKGLRSGRIVPVAPPGDALARIFRFALNSFPDTS